MARSPKVWIAGILALSVFWCMISLLAISRLETRLPSEMQEQLEFHASFSGLWPRSQAGLNASTNGMHLPFAEASMSHKHRKKRPKATGEQDDGQEEQEQEAEDAPSDQLLSSAADASTDYVQQPPSLAAEADDEVADDWSIWQPAVAALKAAFSAEQSDRQMLRGLKSVPS
ncbi:g7578 [Coccomyxa elongata]